MMATERIAYGLGYPRATERVRNPVKDIEDLVGGVLMVIRARFFSSGTTNKDATIQQGRDRIVSITTTNGTHYVIEDCCHRVYIPVDNPFIKPPIL